MRVLVVVAVLLLVGVAITTLLYISKDTSPSVGDDATINTPARSASETKPSVTDATVARAGVTCSSVGDDSTADTPVRSVSVTK